MRFTRWDQQISTESSNEVLFLLADWHLSEVLNPSTDFEVVCLALLERDLWVLCHHDLSSGHTANDHYHLYQILAFFKKRRDLEIGIDKKAVSEATFMGSEKLCKETNDLFRSYSRGGFYFLPRVESVIYGAQRKISKILGDLPSISELRLRFGPGATTQLKKRDASARRKLSSRFSCNGNAVRFLEDLAAECPDWFGVKPDGSATFQLDIEDERVEFVPKSAKTYRKIAKAPLLDTFVQLGIGDFMSDRLRLAGVDLRDQTLNQRLAREGSITGALATLDLSSASDTIACGLVESLLPFDWWDFLRSFRSSGTITDKGRIILQSFASMGNGFTFPLETLIFYSLAHSCVQSLGLDCSKIAVYGDDIIVPVEGVSLLIECLTACGFVVNKSKSFWNGTYRESCGKDYVSGIDVRPCFIKDTLSGHQWFVLHNYYVRTNQPEPAEIVLTMIDESLALWGPDGYGDGHLIGDYDPCPFNRHLGWGGFTFETYTYKSRRAFYALGADYVYPSYSIYMKGDGHSSDSLFREKLRKRDVHGVLRPERSDSEYIGHSGRTVLRDTLPGVDGYKRIKIYTLGR